MEAMDNISRPKMRIFMRVVASCGAVGAGLANITRGLEQYEIWDIVAGAGFCLLPSYFLYASFATSGWYKKRKRLISTTALIGMALVILGDAVPMFGINPVMWLAGGSHATPSALVQHPFIYNHQQVETNGYLATNDRGECVLEVGGAGESRSSVIVLASRGLKCKPDSAQRVWASVSGRFQVYETSKGFDIPYALMNAQGIPVSLRGANNGT
jgi:hypothetical protein